MPVSEDCVRKIVVDKIEKFERECFPSYLHKKNAGKKDQTNFMALRYFTVKECRAFSLYKGSATKLGKEFYQEVVFDIADQVIRQEVLSGSGKIDIILKRYYEVEWFDRICDKHGLQKPEKKRNKNYRIYLIQVTTESTSKSGSAKEGMLGDLAKKRLEMLREDSEQDIVLIVYNIFGTLTAQRNGTVGSKNYTCYELSGKVGFDWLIDDEDGTLCKIFYDAMSKENTPVDIELENLLKSMKISAA